MTEILLRRSEYRDLILFIDLVSFKIPLVRCLTHHTSSICSIHFTSLPDSERCAVQVEHTEDTFTGLDTIFEISILLSIQILIAFWRHFIKHVLADFV